MSIWPGVSGMPLWLAHMPGALWNWQHVQASPRLPRAYSLACRGTAQGVSEDYQAAIKSFAEGVDFVRAARVAMEIEPEMLASIADCQLRSGRFTAAIDQKHKQLLSLKTVTPGYRNVARLSRSLLHSPPTVIEKGSVKQKRYSSTALKR